MLSFYMGASGLYAWFACSEWDECICQYPHKQACLLICELRKLQNISVVEKKII